MHGRERRISYGRRSCYGEVRYLNLLKATSQVSIRGLIQGASPCSSSFLQRKRCRQYQDCITVFKFQTEARLSHCSTGPRTGRSVTQLLLSVAATRLFNHPSYWLELVYPPRSLWCLPSPYRALVEDFCSLTRFERCTKIQWSEKSLENGVRTGQ